MKNLFKDRVIFMNYLCGAVLVLMFILQFLPYWSFDYTHTYKVDVEVEVTKEPVQDEEVVAEDGEEVIEAEPEVITEIVTQKVSEPAKGRVSLQGYCWFPNTQEGVALIEQHLPQIVDAEVVASRSKPFSSNDVVLVPVIQFACALFVVLFCIFFSKNIGINIATIIGGGVGIWGFIASPVLTTQGMWILYFIISILIFAVGIAGFVVNSKYMLGKRRERLEFLKNRYLGA